MTNTNHLQEEDGKVTHQTNGFGGGMEEKTHRVGGGELDWWSER
jgi:hypothetical protein